MYKNENIVNFIKSLYKSKDFLPLHNPYFSGNEKKYLEECINSTFVSSIGKYVDKFEEMIAKYTGAKYAIATVNGTSALHIALKLAGVESGDEVITQALTFIATANAISYCNARPVFLDVDSDNLGLSPDKLKLFLEKNTYKNADGYTYNSITNKKISACVPMHTFGQVCEIEEIKKICDKYSISLIEDAAESLGSFYNNTHTGRFGLAGIFSFNGNKIITTGGGGMIITDNDDFAKKAKHITTTAKVPHKWEFVHDMVGYNYRLPNINAALGCAQMENLPFIIENKKELAKQYCRFFKNIKVKFISAPAYTTSNYWLNAIVLDDMQERDCFLKYSNDNGVMTRPIWTLMNKLEMFKNCQTDELLNSNYLEERVVNIPSSVCL
jgi:perosamine synthetase